MTKADDLEAFAVQGMVERIKPALAGRDPALQGAALADLVSLWLAGHPPALRETFFADWIKTVRLLIPESEAEIFAGRTKPPGWKTQ